MSISFFSQSLLLASRMKEKKHKKHKENEDKRLVKKKTRRL